jgi:hypothetical protein
MFQFDYHFITLDHTMGSRQKVHGELSKKEGGTDELPSWYVHFLKI